ncbi:GHKL domain-containing protein [Clostridium botulinum]|uniref:GHKL domain-containing protein n=2 Tax=Clostridium botulinum TaxID=1491 RepID=A0A846I7R1_CLOBO|nr:GHKL domain-containing protein [Clostridium botulinum]AJD29013.1 histidine kinase-, DNA gyrase B-, and HSP90-like ATPase family protein [Clostridium botulinum CDC_297]ACQ53523.1 sensor histidine kinase [Clostridium botulinum Ba4 str. 657]AJE09423.1 histidine kinase-, DNA gyrase B-, and HSP90-like ATPase family protein [Clostridium botulinum CDC_1436]APR01496.1 histidine kinase-, DNA gyrase B-, and HSP90-like ATPase family protein [Clostridium botulinum]APU60066.1 histidine kinase-, DNA gyra
MTFTNFINMFLHYTIIPSVLMSILCSISIYILYKNILSISDIKKYFIISFVVGMVLTTGSYTLILPILSVITIVQLKNNENEDKIKILVTIYGVYFANTIYIFIYTFSGARLYNIPLKYTLIQFIIMLFIIVILCLIIKRIGSKKKRNRELSSDEIRFRMILIINTLLTVMIASIYIFTCTSIINNEKIGFIMGNFVPEALPLISIILTSIIVYYYDKSVEYRVKLRREIEEKNEIEEYSHIIEEMYSETRRFKHDYINMLSPLKEYIDNGDIEGLSEFFYSNVIDMDKNIKWSNSNIDKLKYIKVQGLKAILSTKLIKASSMNIDINVHIVEDIDYIHMKIMDLCRIIGILMDNSIEAAGECEAPKICIVVANKNDYVVIAVHNNFFGDKPLIHKIYKEGFSTKGRGRGLGLYTVKNIIDIKYENIFLNTSIEGNVFIQEIWIKYI